MENWWRQKKPHMSQLIHWQFLVLRISENKGLQVININKLSISRLDLQKLQPILRKTIIRFWLNWKIHQSNLWDLLLNLKRHRKFWIDLQIGQIQISRRLKNSRKLNRNRTLKSIQRGRCKKSIDSMKFKKALTLKTIQFIVRLKLKIWEETYKTAQTSWTRLKNQWDL